MKRLLPDYRSLRALFGLAVIALQLLGALHFTLVRHGYSAAMGGVVHVHAFSRGEHRLQAKRVAAGTTTLTADTPSCSAELCPVGNAPHGSAPRFEPRATGVIAFGEARLLCKRAACSSASQRVFLSAPKTSPPV
ncbi:MAG TPA: hypothetical protein VJV79_07160 [Polyangiaceae bacterium]|nr:hypothetical protein [Polyangiaceae bacterium]